MRKIIKYFLFISLFLVIITGSLLLYTSHYIYTIVLNPKGDKSLFSDYFRQTERVLPKDLLDISEDIFIQAYDDIQLHSYQFSNTGDTWVIVAHGYMSEAASMGWAIQQFYQMGYHVLAPDLRGHGKSEGEYIAMGWEDRWDILSWITYIREQDTNSQIILFGVSMGAAAMMNVGGEKVPENVKVIIEDSGFTSGEDVFSYHLDTMYNMPRFPLVTIATWMSEIRTGVSMSEGPIYQLQKCQLPILFIHGDKDPLIPIEMMYDMYQIYRGPKERLIISNAGHGTANQVDVKTYWETIITFIDRYV